MQYALRASERNIGERADAGPSLLVVVAIPWGAPPRADPENCRMALTSSVSEATIAREKRRFRVNSKYAPDDGTEKHSSWF